MTTAQETWIMPKEVYSAPNMIFSMGHVVKLETATISRYLGLKHASNMQAYGINMWFAMDAKLWLALIAYYADQRSRISLGYHRHITHCLLVISLALFHLST